MDTAPQKLGLGRHINSDTSRIRSHYSCSTLLLALSYVVRLWRCTLRWVFFLVSFHFPSSEGI